MDKLSEKIPVCSEGAGIQVVIVSCQDLDGQPQFEVGITEAIEIEASLVVGVDGQAVEVSQDHAAHRTAEEIPDVVGLASVDGGSGASK